MEAKSFDTGVREERLKDTPGDRAAINNLGWYQRQITLQVEFF
jgi:hypothetical protein